MSDVVRVHARTVSKWPPGQGGKRLPYDVAVELGEVSGRAECISVRFVARDDAPTPITSEGVRAIPLGALIQHVREEYARDVGLISRTGSPKVRGPSASRVSAVEAGTRRRSQRTDEDLRLVAKVYRSAWSAGKPVTSAVAQAMHVAENTAPKLIAQARRRGFLPDTKPGVARGGTGQ
jgi:hypothetical protein